MIKDELYDRGLVMRDQMFGSETASSHRVSPYRRGPLRRRLQLLGIFSATASARR